MPVVRLHEQPAHYKETVHEKGLLGGDSIVGVLFSLKYPPTENQQLTLSQAYFTFNM